MEADFGGGGRGSGRGEGSKTPFSRESIESVGKEVEKSIYSMEAMEAKNLTFL